jgi:hypothetical protein
VTPDPDIFCAVFRAIRQYLLTWEYSQDHVHDMYKLVQWCLDLERLWSRQLLEPGGAWYTVTTGRMKPGWLEFRVIECRYNVVMQASRNSTSNPFKEKGARKAERTIILPQIRQERTS